MKKTFIFGLSLAVLSPLFVFATGKKPIAPITPNIPDVPSFIRQVLDIAMKLSVPIAAFFLIWAGFLFVTAQGNTTQLTRARSAFMWAVIGTAVALGSWMLATAIESTITAVGGGSVMPG